MENRSEASLAELPAAARFQFRYIKRTIGWYPRIPSQKNRLIQNHRKQPKTGWRVRTRRVPYKAQAGQEDRPQSAPASSRSIPKAVESCRPHPGSCHGAGCAATMPRPENTPQQSEKEQRNTRMMSPKGELMIQAARQAGQCRRQDRSLRKMPAEARRRSRQASRPLWQRHGLR